MNRESLSWPNPNAMQPPMSVDSKARREIAMAAMPVLLADDLKKSVADQMGQKWVAEQAYKMADAMLLEGAK